MSQFPLTSFSRDFCKSPSNSLDPMKYAKDPISARSGRSRPEDFCFFLFRFLRYCGTTFGFIVDSERYAYKFLFNAPSTFNDNSLWVPGHPLIIRPSKLFASISMFFQSCLESAKCFSRLSGNLINLFKFLLQSRAFRY